MKKDDVRTLIVILIVCSILSIIFFILNYKSKYEKLKVVNDYQEFFSVSADINEFIGYVASGDINSVINVLDGKYIDYNSINNDNVFDYIDEYSYNDSFKAKTIKYVNVGKNKLYYAKGILIENNIDGSKVVNDEYHVIVLVDSSSNCYSIYPIDDSDVKGIINGIKKINISSSNYNTIKAINEFDDVALCRLYFSDFYSYIINDMEKAYSLLSDSMLKKYPSSDGFNKFIRSNATKMTSVTKLCSISNSKKGKLISVIDNNDNNYTFNVKNIMDYDVSIVFKETEAKE